MILSDFISKYTNKKIDYDGWYGAQCMDLMHQYIDEVLLNTRSPETLRAPSAKAAYANFVSNDLFEKIPNTPLGIPREGDIIFWGGGEFGHVAIIIAATVSDFTSFDQNYPLNSACHTQYHDYQNVVGWIRYKTPLDDCQLIELDRDYQEREKEKYKKEARDQRKIIDELIEEIKAKNKNITGLQIDIQEEKITSDTLVSKLFDRESEYELLFEKKNALEVTVDDLKAQLKVCRAKVTRLENQIAKIKNRGTLLAFSWKERFISLFIRK